MSIVYCRHLGENVDEFRSSIFKVCVRCMSVAVFIKFVLGICGMNVAVNMLASSTRSVESCCLMFDMRR